MGGLFISSCLSYRSLAQHFDFTEALIKWAHSRLRSYFMSASVGSKGKVNIGKLLNPHS
jgi:hypothetical protein